MNALDPVADYMAALSPAERSGLNRLRAIVTAAAPILHEEIKWNAPSYTHRGHDRVTLGLERKGGFRVVLHRGARPEAKSAGRIADEAGLARWPSSDRGLVQFRDEAAIGAVAPELQCLIADWICANTPDEVG